MTKKLLILGTRTLAVEIADVASEIPGVDLAGFVENLDRDAVGGKLEGLPVYWIDDLAVLKETHVAIGGLATTARDRFIAQAAALGMEFATLIHPSARISKKAQIGEGVFISAGCIVGAHARITAHVFLNRGVLVGHHTEIGAFSTLQPGANVAGCCRIADRTLIGMGAIVVDRINVGAGALIGAGSVVTKDVAAGAQVFGNPARAIRKSPS